jgi:ferredoxin-NADP reductase
LAIVRYKIVSIAHPAPEVRVFRLSPLEGSVIPYAPGQFVFLHMLDERGASLLRRPYSIASAPSSSFLEFAIDMVGGQMTSRLERLEEGAVLGVEGPAGHMVFKGEPKAAFIGGGTGVAPFIGMLRHIAEKAIPGRFVLFYSTRTREHMLYRDELEMLQKRHAGIKVVITLTRETPEGWPGECGRISSEMMLRHVPDAKDFDWYVCGPPGLVKSARECLASLSVDPKRLRMEGWG